jgi:hypothetical protein
MPTTYAIPNGSTAFAATTYTGSGSTQSISNQVNGTSFQPDLVWIKSRVTTRYHNLYDTVRGVGKALYTNVTSPEDAGATDCLTAFNSNGFSLGADGSRRGANVNGDSLIAWQWKAGGAAVSNTAGSITSQVSANTTAGFSVVTYTGNGAAGATVGHGLGVAPALYIIKNRILGQNWICFGTALDAITSNGVMPLNTTGPMTQSATNTAGTSSVFPLSAGGDVNGQNDTHIAYCWAAVPGYSAFSRYIGNGSTNGPFVYLGFRARFLMIKRTDSPSGWVMLDTSRDPYNIVGNYLYANSYAADAGPSSNVLDINSNGFKIRNTLTDINADGGSYIYMAFAENPFKYANAR